ncbi:MAG: NAD(P)/FAD-dependent oxidoreductase [Candidatus Cloacimonetes bacterium]|nr:NAD(P)/FAD-dependent oxidoreductase [Candidatus Cloacimonadota bacterium]
MDSQIIIIGGGASGMMAAGMAAQRGLRTILIEKNPVLGRKLLLTGKGRCNLTNYCEVDELIENIPVNGKFLTNAFYKFSSKETISFFNKLGLEIKVERGKRVFPASDKAKDVIEVLIKFVVSNGVNVIHSSALDIMKFGKIFAVKLQNGEVIRGNKLIIATGGKSYPGTGSTGDGYKFARKFGHTIKKYKPSLVPIEAKHEWAPRADELLLKNVAIKILDKNNKVVYKDSGEMFFTKFGVSGPVILSASSHVRNIKNHKLFIDLKPALSEEKLDIRIQRDFNEYSRKQFKAVLKNLLPNKLVPIIIELSKIPARKQVHQITKEERKNLVFLLKNLSLKLDKFRSIKEAIVTSGGVDVKEIAPKTMESKLVPGLYFAGEVIDVDGHTGGFNLQIAWSAGFVAGSSV